MYVCRSPVPWVLWAAIYGPINLDMAQFLPAVNDWGTKYSIPDMVPPLLAKGGGTTNLKELNSSMTCTGLFVPPQQSQAGRISPPVSLI
jgi:hypothetical protein